MKTFFIILFAACWLNCSAQYYTTSHASIHFQNRSFGFITELPPAPAKLKGDVYLYSDWRKADIYLKDSTAIRNVNIRADLEGNSLEIQHEKEVKVLPFSRLLALSLYGDNGRIEEYINGDLLNERGLLQVIYDGKVQLVCRIQMKIVPADYNPALDVGRRDNELTINKRYLIIKGKTIIDAGTTKTRFRKDMIQKFGNGVESLVNETNIKDSGELISLVRELNERS